MKKDIVKSIIEHSEKNKLKNKSNL